MEPDWVSTVEVHYPEHPPKGGTPIQIWLAGVPVFNITAVIADNEYHEQVVQVSVEKVGR